MGKYHVLNLGNGTGYLNMGTRVGTAVKALSDWTVSVYYRVDTNADAASWRCTAGLSDVHCQYLGGAQPVVLTVHRQEIRGAPREHPWQK